jgi:crossover junction endodeoxyribonuclease RusA
MASVSFFVPGIPRPKGSYRPISIKSKKGQRTVLLSPASTVEWQAKVALAAREARVPLAEGPVAVFLVFVLPRPKKPTHPYPTRPDIDKLARAVLDGLTGVAFGDDGQVCRLFAWKYWPTDGDPEEFVGCRVELRGEE